LNTRLNEIYWLRAYGCLAVFTFHLITHIEDHFPAHVGLDIGRIPASLGTPVFIFISVVLFSTRYGEQLPNGFLRRRLKYLLGPYLAFGLIYSTAEYLRLRGSGDDAGLLATWVDYLLFAGWHGYFLLLASQFYVLYWLLTQTSLLPWLGQTHVLLASLGLAVGYWALWTFLVDTPPGYVHWILPFGWLYLFVLGLWVRAPTDDTARQRSGLAPPSVGAWLPAAWLIAGLILVGLSLSGGLNYSSKEVWVAPFFVLSLLLALRLLQGREPSGTVRWLNRYSFSIYLAHPMFFAIADATGLPMRLPAWGYALTVGAFGLVGAVLLSELVNRQEWSAMLFGRQQRVS